MDKAVTNASLSISRIFYKPSKENECRTCGGNGWVTVNKLVTGLYPKDTVCGYAVECPTCRGGIVETVKRTADIPPTYYEKKYEAFDWNLYKDSDGQMIDMSKQRRVVENFLQNFKKWDDNGLGLYIHSKTKGSGKSFLASCLCNELMEQYAIRTRFVNATALIDISQSGNRDSLNEFEKDPITLLCKCKLLVIDDIGQKRTAEDWMNEILFRIIDYRMNHGLVTIMTSNIKPEELSIDDRIIERIIKISISIHLPEYNVRSRASNDEKLKFLSDVGLRGDKK